MTNAKGRRLLWLLLPPLLLLLIFIAGFFGLRSDSSYLPALRSLWTENREQSAVLRTLRAEDAVRNGEIRQLRAEGEAKDSQIQDLKKANGERDAQIAALEGDIDDQAARIRELNAALAAAALPEASPSEAGETAPVQAESAPEPDAWGYVDEDGDGLILVPIRGKFMGYMLIVLDPSRVVLGCDPATLGGVGHELGFYVEKAGAVAGVNGGGFADPGGMGNGGMPDSVIAAGGQYYFTGNGPGHGFAGIDDRFVLHVGLSSVAEMNELHIQEGCSYGPVLIRDGQMNSPDRLQSGTNPRTAIGQRSDGAILLLAIEGRQPSRLGCSFRDEAELMLRFGAVNACNMDGGTSSMMWYEGEYINNRAHVVNIRPIPTSWIVLPEGRDGND